MGPSRPCGLRVGGIPTRYVEGVAAFGDRIGAFRRRSGASPIVARTDVPADDTRALDEAIPDLDWRTLPPGTERTIFDAPSGPLARIALKPGQGPRVLLVPGATGLKEDFILMLPLLAAAGYRAESFDLAGQYESFAAGPRRLDPPRERYDERLFLDDLRAVLADGNSPVHVLGYSFAGTVAQLALREVPERFASLTLLSCPARTWGGVPRREGDRPAVRGHDRPSGGIAHAVGPAQQPEPGAAGTARVRARTVRTHSPGERR